MEPGIFLLLLLLLLLVVGGPIALFVWLGTKASRADRGVRNLGARVDSLQIEVRTLRDVLRSYEGVSTGQPPIVAPPSKPVPTPLAESVLTTPLPPPIGQRQPQDVPPLVTEAEETSAVSPPIAPPPSQAPSSPWEDFPPANGQTAPRPPQMSSPSINWEQFMGVKLFAWIGGLALFLGLAFFVKYSFDNNLVSPEIRVAIGYIIGVGLLVGGLVLAGREYSVLGQTLCATGVLALYANVFASYAFYHFIGVIPAFALMVLVTAVAFLLAVRLDAQVVAILGLLGGFLTPVLLSTGQDHPLGLFSYIALLDAGLTAVVARKRWNYLVLLAAVGTLVMQIGWTVKFFAAVKVFTAMNVLLGFEALFLLAFVVTDRDDPWISASTIGMAFAPLVFTLYLLSFGELGAKPWIIFTFVLVADLGLLTVAVLRSALAPAHLAAGLAAFVLLSIWTINYVSGALLNWALGFYLLFAILHTAFPIVLQRLRPGAMPVWWGHLFPLIALVLVMIPVMKLPDLGWLVWLCVLALDVVVFALALVTASVLAILGALVLTLGATVVWLFKVPAVASSVPDLLVVIGGFALVFFAVGVFATRRMALKPAGNRVDPPPLPSLPFLSDNVQAQIPALSAILPFLLLIMVVLRMPLTSPSPVFGLAMLLVVLLLGVARWTGAEWLTAIGLVCSVALEYAWHQTRFKVEAPMVPLIWYLAFTAAFTIFPFIFRKELENSVVPWAVSALAGPAHFTLVYWLVKAAWPNPMMGLLPAAFALPPLIGLLVLLRVQGPQRLALLAWFGGVTLFFITLIFPIQFDRQWITIGWALEGTALLWLFHRVPHPGLRLVGVGLLCAAFARLALNPAVLEYHARSATPILNWFLYAYGITAICLFVGSRLLAPPRQEVLGANARALLATLGTVLAFLLVNIEIADYFTAPGSSALTFEFSNVGAIAYGYGSAPTSLISTNFTRDMTYSIAWALYGLVLLVFGIAKKLTAVRYASLALIGVTLLKLFFHDLRQLGQLQRIGAFVGVAVVLLVSSFLYQRFVAAEVKAE
jgi:uncharacterized membrane protein